jgi:hypothetical protein
VVTNGSRFKLVDTSEQTDLKVLISMIIPRMLDTTYLVVCNANELDEDDLRLILTWAAAVVFSVEDADLSNQPLRNSCPLSCGLLWLV